MCRGGGGLGMKVRQGLLLAWPPVHVHLPVQHGHTAGSAQVAPQYSVPHSCARSESPSPPDYNNTFSNRTHDHKYHLGIGCTNSLVPR